MVVSTGTGWRRLWRMDPDGGEPAPLSSVGDDRLGVRRGAG